MHTTLPSTGDTTHKALHARQCRCHHVRDHACVASLRRHRRCTPRWFPKTCSLVACSWGHHTPKVSALAIGYRAHVAATVSYSDAFAWYDRPLHSSYLVPTHHMVVMLCPEAGTSHCTHARIHIARSTKAAARVAGIVRLRTLRRQQPTPLVSVRAHRHSHCSDGATNKCNGVVTPGFRASELDAKSGDATGVQASPVMSAKATQLQHDNNVRTWPGVGVGT